VGVYCYVKMCVVAEAPLPLDTRVAVIELAIEHELVSEQCSVNVRRVLPPRGLVDRVTRLFRRAPTYFAAVEKGPPGPWIGERVRALATVDEVQIACGFPKWKAEPPTGPFIYLATRTPQTVTLHQPPELIGHFYDVMTLDAKRGLDGRSVASSRFMRALKQLTGTKVICRSEWI